MQVLTDHKGFEYFMTTKELIPKQARWAEFLSKFNFVISYQNNKKNDKADALTRKPGDRPADKEDEWLEHCMQVLLPPEHFGKSIELQLSKENEEYLPNIKTPNPVGQPDPVGQTESNKKDSTLPEQVMQANQKENSYASICAYLKNPEVHAKTRECQAEGL